MKKKVFFNGRFLSQSVTGVQRTAFELIQALDELIGRNAVNTEGIEYILIHPPLKTCSIKLKHIVLLQKGKLNGNLWEQIELPFYTKGHLLISLCMVSSLLKSNQLVMIHDACCFAQPRFFSFAFRQWYQFAIPLLGKRSKGIITVSEFSKRELAKYANISPDKISVIYNAADHMLNYAEPPEEFKNKVKSLKPYILAVSSLNPNKNFVSITKAVSNLQAGVNIVIAGAKDIKSFSKAGIDHSAYHMGYVSNSELKHLYTEAELFVFPSFYEGFGIPPLEAMILGCPVLASDTGALPEVLGNAGTYCNPYNELDIREKIEALLADLPKRSTLKISGLAKAGQYSWTKSAAELHQLTTTFI